MSEFIINNNITTESIPAIDTAEVVIDTVKTEPQDSVSLSSIIGALDGRSIPDQTLTGIVVDVSGMRIGGTLGRMYNALKIGGTVTVDKRVHEEYENALRRYFGNGKHKQKSVQYTKS